MRTYKYKERCKECKEKVQSNWAQGGSSVQQKMLRHRIEKHAYVPTAEEKKLLASV